MAPTSEIEKLERRCAENPHGLTFAPLAEAYRKHGELDRALEVLRAGRELHPDYIPASIVLGRCHLDRNELAEAERAFAHVLTLDPENVIALKALAELAEREGRGVQAERWLNLLLAVDPSNDEARAQLERVRSGDAVPAADPGQEEPAAPEPETPPELEAPAGLEGSTEGEARDELAAVGDPAAAAAMEPVAEAAAEPASEPEIAPEPELAPEPEAVPEAEPHPETDVQPAAEMEPETAPLAGFIPEEPFMAAAERWQDEAPAPDEEPGPIEAAAEAAPFIEREDDPLSLDPGSLAAEEPIIYRPEEIVLNPAPHSDYRDEVPGALPEIATDEPDVPEAAASELEPVPDLGVGEPEHDPFAGVEPFEGDLEPAGAEASEPARLLEPELPTDSPAQEPVAVAPDEPADAAPADHEPAESEPSYLSASPEPAPVVTESMAELYLRQGHRAEALEIYRELAARRPDDERLAALASDLAAEVERAVPQPLAYAAAQTGGRSVTELLRAVLAERLPPAPAEPFTAPADAPGLRGAEEVLADAEDQGAPTQPASDHLTLGAVFGDEEPGAPPALPAPDAGSAGPADQGISFDEFFGGPPAAPADATRTARPAPGGDDDLDQFHAWLQGLKR